MTRPFPFFLFLSVAYQTTTAFADDGPANNVPELQALSSYIGKWDVVIAAEGSPTKVKGERTAEWILDGRFVQQSGFLTNADGKPYMKITTLMTYDQKEKAYRRWEFNSLGSASESVGTWDATKQTMTWVRSKGGTNTTVTANFAEKGREQWTIVTINEKTGSLTTFGGTNTRRKP